MERNSEAERILWAFLLFALLILGLVFAFSKHIGADFQVTLTAVLYSSVILVIVGVLVWHFQPPVLPTIGATLVILWPIWWPVLDSIAQGMMATAVFLPEDVGPSLPWWDGDIFKWGMEVVLVGATAFLSFKSQNAR